MPKSSGFNFLKVVLHFCFVLVGNLIKFPFVYLDTILPLIPVEELISCLSKNLVKKHLNSCIWQYTHTHTHTLLSAWPNSPGVELLGGWGCRGGTKQSFGKDNGKSPCVCVCVCEAPQPSTPCAVYRLFSRP